MPMPWSSDIPAMYLAQQSLSATCATAGRRRRPRPSEVHARYTCGQSPGGDISRGATVRTRSPSAGCAAASPPGREARNELKPGPPSVSRPAGRSSGVPGPDRDRDRLPGSAQPECRTELPKTSLTSKTATSPHGCPGPSIAETNARAARARSRPPGKRHPLPNRPSHQCTRLPGRPRPGNRAGPRADTPDARPARRRTSSQHTVPARPVHVVRGRPSGYTDRPTGTKPVRYASVDGAI